MATSEHDSPAIAMSLRQRLNQLPGDALSLSVRGNAEVDDLDVMPREVIEQVPAELVVLNGRQEGPSAGPVHESFVGEKPQRAFRWAVAKLNDGLSQRALWLDFDDFDLRAHLVSRLASPRLSPLTRQEQAEILWTQEDSGIRSALHWAGGVFVVSITSGLNLDYSGKDGSMEVSASFAIVSMETPNTDEIWTIVAHVGST